MFAQRAGDRDALLLAAAERAWPVSEPIGETDCTEQLAGARPAPAARHTLERQRELDVLERGELTEQSEVLEDEPHDLAPVARHLVTIEAGEVVAGDDHRTAVGTVEPAEHGEQRRLAGSRRARDRDTTEPAAMSKSMPSRTTSSPSGVS